MVELSKEQRNKFLTLVRNFIKEEFDIEVSEEVYIVPDVEFNQMIVQALGVHGSNPFLLDPKVVTKLLETAVYTFTWYQFIQDAESLEAETRVHGISGGSIGSISPWADEDEEDEDGSVH
jgi:hypothetical protein